MDSGFPRTLLAIVLALLLFSPFDALSETCPGFQWAWGGYGSACGKFDGPQSIVIDNDGNIYVADTNNYRIQKFTSNGTRLLCWGSPGSDPWSIGHVEGLAIDSDNYLYVGAGPHIQIFRPDGTYVMRWGIAGAGEGQINSIKDIAMAPGDTLYVLDDLPLPEGYRISKFLADSTFVGEWRFADDGEGANALAVDSRGCLYTLDNDQVFVRTPDNVVVRSWGSKGTGPGQFDLPFAVAVDASGDVYVCDGRNARVQKFAHNGRFLCQWGSHGTLPGQFSWPAGIAVGKDCSVYVSDSGWNIDRIQWFYNTPLAITRVHDPGTGSDLIVNWRVCGLGQSEWTRAILTDGPYASGNVLRESPAFTPDMSENFPQFQYVFRDLDTYRPYYVAVTTSAEDTVLYDLDEPQRASVPVFLLHGLNSNAGIWGNATSGMINWLSAMGAAYPTPVDLLPLGSPGEVHFTTNATILANRVATKIDSIAQGTAWITGQDLRPSMIDIMAHSMGGLAARRYIEGSEFDSGRPAIRRFLMLGTPNGGSFVAQVGKQLHRFGTLTGSPVRLLCDLAPALCELCLEDMASFNSLYGNSLMPGQVWIASGDAGRLDFDCGSLPNAACWSPLIFSSVAEQCPNDGVVSWQSTTAYFRHTPSLIPQYAYRGPYCHVSSPPIASYYNDYSLFGLWIEPVLTGEATAKGWARDPMNTMASSCAPNFCAEVFGTVAAGASAVEQIVLEPGAAGLRLMAAVPCLTITLQSPSGATIDSLSAASDPDVDFFSGPYVREYVLADAEPGVWSVTISATGLTDAMAAYAVTATSSTSAYMSPSVVPAAPSLGSGLLLMAELEDDIGPLVGAAVSVTPGLGDSTWAEEVALHDDGFHGDGAANDGVYASLFAAEAGPGVYRFGFRAEGESGSAGTYRRLATAAFSVDQLTSVPAPSVRDVPPGQSIRIGAAAPSPTSGPSILQYEVLDQQVVALEVVDLRGRMVATLINENHDVGEYWARWDGRDGRGRRVPAGVYYLRLRGKSTVATTKVVILK